MPEHIRLGVFDVDGTVRTREGEVPTEVIAGFANIWEAGMTTTLLTGRIYSRVREVLGNTFTSLVSPNAPLGVDNGGRATNREGTANLFYHPLALDEIQSILQLSTESEIKLVAYAPYDLTRRAVVWTPNPTLTEVLTQKYGHFADVSSGKASEFETKMRVDAPCMLTVQPHNPQYAGEFTSMGLNAVGNEGFINVTTAGVDKGSALAGIIDYVNSLGDQSQQLNMKHVLFAGNDQNDLPAFSRNIGRRVVVGNELVGILTLPYDQVAHPVGLGTWLGNLSRI